MTAGRGERAGADSAGTRAANVGSLDILHVVESTSSGVRRYLEGMAAVSNGPEFGRIGIAYSPNSRGAGFWKLFERMQGLGWRTYEVPMTREVAPVADCHATMRLRRIVREFRPTILHAHSSKAGALTRLAGVSLGFRRPCVVYSPNALAVGMGRRYVAAEWILGRLGTEVVTGMCDSDVREIRAAGVVPCAVLAVPPAIDAAYYRPRPQAEARRRLCLPEGARIIVGVGRMTPQKDPETFVRILAGVASAVTGVRGIWIGDGELRAPVEELATRSLVGGVFQVTGWLDDVRDYIAASDVVVFPSRYESFGYVTAEALCMSRPVVGTRIPGTVDLLRREPMGALIPPGDASAGAAAVVNLLERADGGGSLGRELVAHEFSEVVMRARLLEAYAAALRARWSR